MQHAERADKALLSGSEASRGCRSAGGNPEKVKQQ
jgi:hypothetical protein